MRKLLYAVLAAPLLLTGITLAKVWRDERDLVRSLAVPLPPLGEATTSQDPRIRRGQEIFNAKGCVYCHGPNATGGVKNPNSQGGQMPALTLVAHGYSASELKARILVGVKEIDKLDPSGPTPPLYMPSWKGHLSGEELEDLVAFLMSLAPKSEAGADDF